MTSTASSQYIEPDPGPIKTERASPSQDQHRRGYQACQPCRQRKVKCDLGSVDNPGTPPCLRCRREHKECIFADTRRKRKTSEGESNDTTTARRRLTAARTPDSGHQDYPANAQYGVSPSFPPATPSPHQWPAHPIHPGNIPQAGSTLQGSRHVESYTSNAPGNTEKSNGNHMLNKAAADALYPPIATSHEALYLLSQAAGQTEEANRQHMQGRHSAIRSPSATFASPRSANVSHTRTYSSSGVIDPAMMNEDGGQIANEDEEYQNSLKTWSRMRFVRAGWFTGQEAMAYIDYYYENLAPLTPIVPPDYRSPSKHIKLLTEEPILAITLLAISSRHMILSGPGSQTKAYAIHDKLWSYLRCMVERLLWGQEQFGGGIFGGGSTRIREENNSQMTWTGSLRTLGTVEAILLLTDWQPRALHFPPGDDENRLLDLDYSSPKHSLGSASRPDEAEVDNAEGGEGIPYANWLSPAWRSDRMSWMLLGLAQALSFELGVFDKNHYTCSDKHDAASDCARKARVRKLVLVYVSQNSGRLGIPCMLPLPHWERDDVFEKTRPQAGLEDSIDIMQNCWLGIASVMYEANIKIFPSHEFTRDLVSSDRYIESIAQFTPKLKKWKANFDSVSARLSEVMRCLLSMEYEYARLYINSLALQKVVESWLKITKENAASANNISSATAGIGTTSVGSGAVGISLLVFDIFKPNKEFIAEVADAARIILKSIVTGLGPGERLRHAPVRTFFRVLSGLMFTLKCFSFGASEHDVRKSLEILDQTTDLLTNCVVDDVHLSAQTASLVKMITANLRKNFIRIQAPTGESREQSRNHTPHGHDHISEHIMQQRGQQSAHFGYKFTQNGEDPLADIPAQYMTDLTNTMFMPPPNYSNYIDSASHFNSSSAQGMNSGAEYNPDWFTVPLDGLVNNSMGIVDQGFAGIGPTVGGRDMLELLTDQHYDDYNMNFPLSNGYQ